MAQFNLQEYETVAERIARFYKDNIDGRIITRNITTSNDRAISTWVVQAYIYLNREDQDKNLAKATGLAFEIDGAGLAQKTSALEVCETSAIGRALANAGYSGDRRATREEMQKVAKGISPTKNWQAALDNINDLEGLRSLYNEAKQGKAPNAILEAIKGKADGINGNKASNKSA
jgi:hypothetical protein